MRPKTVRTENATQQPIAASDLAFSEDVRLGLELQFFAHRNLVNDSDQQLEHLQLGRTHHRAMYFTARYPGLTVGELIAILRLTPQGVQKAMSDLVKQELIQQVTSLKDRRLRQLYMTDKGNALLAELTQLQFARIQRAYEKAGPKAVKGFLCVLSSMLSAEELAWLK